MNSTMYEQAQLAWLYLIYAAANRQTFTYKTLGEKIDVHHRQVGKVLDPIYHYCEQQGLPTLTIIVVNQTTGQPGNAEEWGNIPVKTEKVFRWNWSQELPPSIPNLQAALEEGTE